MTTDVKKKGEGCRYTISLLIRTCKWGQECKRLVVSKKMRETDEKQEARVCTSADC